MALKFIHFYTLCAELSSESSLGYDRINTYALDSQRRGGGSPPPRYVPLQRHRIPQGYRIEEVRTPGLARVSFGEETGNLYRINLPARVLISPDNFIVGIVRLRCLLRIYYTTLYGRQPVRVNLYNDNIELLSEEEHSILPFHRLIE